MWLKIKEPGLRRFSLWLHLPRCYFGTFFGATAKYEVEPKVTALIAQDGRPAEELCFEIQAERGLGMR